MDRHSDKWRERLRVSFSFIVESVKMFAMMTSVGTPPCVFEEFSTVCPPERIERDYISLCFLHVFSTREFLYSLLVSVVSSSVRVSFSELAGFG